MKACKAFKIKLSLVGHQWSWRSINHVVTGSLNTVNRSVEVFSTKQFQLQKDVADETVRLGAIDELKM